MSWIAYVDESIRTDDGVYVLAAVMLDEDDAATVRETVRTLEPRPGLRFHWRDQKPPGRLEAASTIAQLASLHIVVIGAPVISRRQERARRQCLETLLFDLETAGIEHVWLESRNQLLDRRDLDVIAGFRARKIVTGKIHIDHAKPGDEPLLWAADIVAGAVGAAEGDVRSYRLLLGGVLTEHRIQLS